MPPLTLSFACGLYDRLVPIATGEVQTPGISLNFIEVEHPRDIFDRMTGSGEFDASELSSSEYIRGMQQEIDLSSGFPPFLRARSATALSSSTPLK
jgi:hypothetical protein